MPRQTTCRNCQQLWTAPTAAGPPPPWCPTCLDTLPDRQCATCGERFRPRSPTSNGYSYCLPCSKPRQDRQQPNPPRSRECARCSAALEPHQIRYCSPACRNARPPCDCGQPKAPHKTRCSSCATEAERERTRRKNRSRRNRKNAAESEPYTMAEIGNRDGWRCHLCQRTIDPNRTDMQGPSIDHLIPLSEHGPDTRINVAIAHRICNTRRATGTAQLRLHG